jgi:carbon storage regulator CsrA
MLVLSRKCQESVVVGGTAGYARLFTVTVLEIRGATVRLGFEAAATIPVHRSEIWARINDAGPPAEPAGGPVTPVA